MENATAPYYSRFSQTCFGWLCRSDERKGRNYDRCFEKWIQNEFGKSSHDVAHYPVCTGHNYRNGNGPRIQHSVRVAKHLTLLSSTRFLTSMNKGDYFLTGNFHFFKTFFQSFLHFLFETFFNIFYTFLFEFLTHFLHFYSNFLTQNVWIFFNKKFFVKIWLNKLLKFAFFVSKYVLKNSC